MSITVKICFNAPLKNVVIKDVLSGEELSLGSVTSGQTQPLEPDDYGGEATVDIHGDRPGQGPVHGRKNLRNGDTYDFPPDAISVLDVIRQYGDLGKLALEIDKLVKQTPSTPAKSRVAKSSRSAPKNPM